MADDLPTMAETDRAEFGWLIEAGDPPHYWDGRKPDSYTNDANDAVRFARFEDAERVRCWLIEGGRHWKSVEHGWCTAGDWK